jgi:tetratricopeptide (TPR) repeat protein
VPAAYEHYLRGRAALLQLTKADTETAIREFEQAIAIDPRYAAAHAGLANAAAQMRIRFAATGDSQRWADRAKDEASRAVELAPDLAEAHEASAAVYRFDEFDWERVMDESGRAIVLNPDLELPHHYRAAAAFHLGLIDVAEREAQIALDLNRSRPVEPLRILGVAALARGNWAAAENYLSEVARKSDIADWYEAVALFHLGRRAEAEALLRQKGGGETRQARASAVLASLLAATGRAPEARDLAQRVSKGLIDHHVAYSIGVAYAQLGDHAMAMTWLRRAVDTGFPCYPFFVSDPLLAPMRNDAPFRAMLHELEVKNAEWRGKYR